MKIAVVPSAGSALRQTLVGQDLQANGAHCEQIDIRRIKPFRAMKAKKTFNVRLKVLLTNLPRPLRIAPEGAFPLLMHISL